MVEISTDYPVRLARVDGKPLTPVYGLRTYWGVPDFRKKNQFVLYGEYFDHTPHFLAQFFTHTKEYYFLLRGKIDRIPIEAGNKLQLSEKTWKKMDDKFDQQKRAQSKKIKKVSQTWQGLFTNYCFQRPIHSKIVSPFASPRTLPNGKSYYHSGMDLRARSPIPIPASATGRVVLAEHMIVPGNIVILDHGGGIMSRYMHLSEFNVNVGDYVQQGEPVGYSGGTGRVEAPHLHWEIIWKGRQVDPLKFVQFTRSRCVDVNLSDNRTPRTPNYN